jgi:hypothetical protein
MAEESYQALLQVGSHADMCTVHMAIDTGEQLLQLDSRVHSDYVGIMPPNAHVIF